MAAILDVSSTAARKSKLKSQKSKVKKVLRIIIKSNNIQLKDVAAYYHRKGKVNKVQLIANGR